MLAPLEMNQVEFCDLCGITPQTVRNWMAEGLPGVTKPVRNAFYVNLREALPWVRDNKWQAADDRARLARIKADDAQLDLDKKLGTLMDAAEAVRAWETGCASMRSRMLSIPSTAQTALGLSPAQGATLRDLVHEALEVLSGRMDTPVDVDVDEEAPAPKPIPAGQRRRGRPRTR